MDESTSELRSSTFELDESTSELRSSTSQLDSSILNGARGLPVNFVVPGDELRPT
ncbi:hypothetical protein [Nostoc sp. NMS9]|uniref:hypothetical protein n=1 Tax=Nostoc sp. NMS9 TaxID=2815393 RepID=UPI0025DC032F|nr:hypothetical protein [Nostoc sp. NMS9]MBN3940420.1 hypothetical protein [Nostoc sp. NMS9]